MKSFLVIYSTNIKKNDTPTHESVAILNCPHANSRYDECKDWMVRVLWTDVPFGGVRRRGM